MGFYIQDDFWDAVEDLSDAEQNAYFGALVRLFYRGDTEAPKGKEPRRAFVLTKARVRGARKSKAKKSHETAYTQGNVGDIDVPDTLPNKLPNELPNQLSNGLQNGFPNELPNQLDTELPNRLSNEEILLKSESEIESRRETEKKTIRRFAPPHPDQVNSFAAENGLSVDGQEFCDYYAAQGWKLSNGNPMKDWMAAARNWSRRDFRKGVKRNADVEQLGEYANAF